MFCNMKKNSHPTIDALLFSGIDDNDFVQKMDELYATPEGRKEIRDFLSDGSSFSKCIGKAALGYLDGKLTWEEFLEQSKTDSLDYYNETKDEESFFHLTSLLDTEKRCKKGID